ncbi:unnamed protein product [Pieris brassicae]|uniref:Uncharacterized protein n=1 Tax=Pieris brassicae TaxID=7116 RepID=A0A9P0TPV1_PIEBR|nr:unnamed protein product [Pieris brassicae]
MFEAISPQSAALYTPAQQFGFRITLHHPPAQRSLLLHTLLVQRLSRHVNSEVLPLPVAGRAALNPNPQTQAIVFSQLAATPSQGGVTPKDLPSVTLQASQCGIYPQLLLVAEDIDTA